MPKVTIVSDTAREVDAVVRGERILLEPEFLQAAIGWTLKPEGLCAEGACVPVREPAALFFDGLVDLASVAAALGRSIVVDPTAAMAALSLSAAERQIALTGRAVDFTLPDLDGTPHRFSEWRGKKRLLVTFSSWCGCRYDLPGWQALHDELAGDNFMVVAVAIDNSAADVTPWVEGFTIPVLVDAQHVLTELYAISNVPTVVWVDEDDRIARPNALAFGTDTFADFTGVAAEPHLSQVRHWAATGEVPGDGASVVADLSKDEVTARLHFRLGAEALRQGKPEAGRWNLERAGELAPYDWTIRRAAMPLLGEDPFGQRFLDLYDEWQDAGAPYHGLPVVRRDAAPQPG